MNRLTRGTIAGAATTLALSSFGPVLGTASATPSTGLTRSVIVMLKDQLTSLPADRAHISQRRSAALSQQDGLLSRMVQQPSHVVHYTAANAVSMTVTATQAAALEVDPSVAVVVPNTKIAVAADALIAKPAVVTRVSSSVGTPASSAICPTDPSQPMLEPEALQDTNDASDDPNADTAQQLTDGSGVTVAYIADTIDPDNPDFIRADGSHVIVDYKSFSADGSTPAAGSAEAYGEASSIAAQGLVSHDLSTFVNPAYPLPAGCNIRILGMAPGASIVALNTDIYTSSIIQAINYAVSVDHVNVLNESFDASQIPDAGARSAIESFNDAAVAAGTTVTVFPGDADPNVVSVAATTNSRAYAQTGFAGARAFGSGPWMNDEISALFSGDSTHSGGTVDLTAPGEAGWAACDATATDCSRFTGGNSDFQLFGGRGESGALTAGAAALVISAYRSTHAGASPTPALVKLLLSGTATDLGLPAFEQGAGLLNARAAVEAALTYPAATSSPPSGVGSKVVVHPGQSEGSGTPGSTEVVHLPVQNVGSAPLTVTTTDRGYQTASVDTVTASISASSGPTFPYPTNGTSWAWKKVQFTVPAATDRTALQATWPGGTASNGGVQPVLGISLFDPSGAYVETSRPLADNTLTNHANLDVREPVAGSWTALLYTPSGATGLTGNVTLRFSHQQAVPVGTISPPTMQLAPGQTGTVTDSFTVPPNGDDPAFALVVSTSAGQTTAAPVTKPATAPAPQPVVVTNTAPGAPTGASANAGDRQAVVSWTPPGNDGGATINGYAVTSFPGGKTCTWSSGPLACTVTGLTNGTSYTFTATATNSVGTGPASAPATPVTPAAGRSVSLHADHRTVPYGHVVALSGTVSSLDPSCVAGATVHIDRQINGQTAVSRDVLSATAGADGSYTVSLTARRSATYAARLDTTSACLRATSTPAAVLVRAVVSISGHHHVDNTGGVTITLTAIPCGGADGPGHQHGTLILQRHAPHGWVEVAAEPSTIGCVAVFHLQPADTVVYRGFWPSQDADHQAGYSRQFRVAV
jgi:hypothetical protein